MSMSGNLVKFDPAKIDGQSRQYREASLVAASNQALIAVSETKDIHVKAKIINDASAIRALAKAWRVNAETQRKVAEASLRCLRSFGVSLHEQYPKAKSKVCEKETGVPFQICSQAITLAGYSEDDLEAAFNEFRAKEKEVGIHETIRILRDYDPKLQAEKERIEKERQKRQQEEAIKRGSDPDFKAILKIRYEFCDNWDACREILRLRRLLAKAVKS